MAKTLYLTFDDGPKLITADVMAVLKAKGILATFFLTGSGGIGNAKQKELVELMINSGHHLGNHCFVHKPASPQEYKDTYGDLTKPGQKAAFKKNLTDNLDHFRTVLGKPDLALPLVRLPGDGRFHQPSVNEVKNLGYKHVAWDYEFAPNGTLGHITEKDWQGVTGVACTFKALPPDKAIVLAHDGHWAGKIDLLRALLKKLQDSGYVFETVSSPLGMV